jgi:carbamoyl-phosphate synthase small subunit
MRGVLSSLESDGQKLVEKARQIPTMSGLDLASRVSTPESYHWTETVQQCSPSDLIGRQAEPRFNVVAYDYGIKHNILRRLVHAGCRSGQIRASLISAAALQIPLELVGIC